jgi:hypothetical protein
VDFEIKMPDGKTWINESAITTIDYVLTSKDTGEYMICFFNSVASSEDKLIDFDVTVEHDMYPDGYIKSELTKAVGNTTKSPSESTPSPLEELFKYASESFSNSLANLSLKLRVIRTNEHRNYNVVESTENRIVNFAIMQVSVILLISIGKNIIIKTFFEKSKGIRV